MSAAWWPMAAGGVLLLAGTLGVGVVLDRQPVGGGMRPEPGMASFRIVADLDGDALPDTFGYATEPPWHTVRFVSRSRRWEARPGDGLEELFASVNERLRFDIESREPDPAKRRAFLARYRICAENVEHGPVAAVGGRLVVMWYMEPLYPAGINTYDLEGRLLSRYVHPGHLRCMTPVATRSGTYLVFGGTNNLLDREPADAVGRPSLNLPIVGAIALGENGVDPLLARSLTGPNGIRLEIASVPFYEIVDRKRNSQVVGLRPLGARCRVAADYEPGTLVGGGYAEKESTAVVDLCGPPTRGQACTFARGVVGRIGRRTRFLSPS